MKILLVDDDETLIELLSRTLEEKGYAVDTVMDGEQGWTYGTTYNYDLIIIDWSLPKLDGISLCKRFRAQGYNIPIILLTSRHGSQNKIQGLDAGADDYICKPFDLEELAARIRTLLRRINCQFLPIMTWEGLQLDPCSCQVTYQKEIISLSAKEYSLLELFLRHSQEVLSIEEIIENLWSSSEYPAEATVRSHIRRLRQKLKLAGLAEDPIATVRGQGYILKPPPLNNNSQNNCHKNNQEDKQSQHLSALASAWEKYQQKSEQQLLILEKTIQSLQAGNLELSDRISAIAISHSLAGNLGLFGFQEGSQLAREIEELLQQNSLLESIQWLKLSAELQVLRQEIVNNHNISPQISRQISQNSPLVLIVDNDIHFTQELTQKAINQGIRTEILPTPELVKIWLEDKQVNHKQLPNLVLLKISALKSYREEYLALIAEFNLLIPSIPVIVIDHFPSFYNQLQVARHGGTVYLQQPVTVSQTMAFCQSILESSFQGKKIMIVDDDVELLQLIPSLLEPWGFKLTTLEDARQFWDVLKAVAPDLLVLDVEMPYLSGIELCKVLRTHPYWSKLPVIFLSVHQDSTICDLAFSSGADDFITKPVVVKQLADRIIHRLRK